MKLLLCLAFLINVANAATNSYSSGGAGSGVKLFKDHLYMKSGLGISQTGVDPRVTATPADEGHLLLANGGLFLKRDAGTTTNWEKVSASGGLELLTSSSFEGQVSEGICTGCTASIESTEVLVTPNNKDSLKMAFSAAAGDYTIDKTTGAQFSGLQAIASCYIKTSASDVRFCARDNSTDTDCLTVSNNDTWKEYVVPFVMGSVNSGYKVEAQVAITDDVYVDECTVQPRELTQEIAQAEHLGILTWPEATSCAWLTTASANVWADFPVDADCTLPTPSGNGIIKEPTTKIPAHILPAGSPAGTYEITYSGAIGVDPTINGGDAWCQWSFYDGTTRVYAGESGQTNTGTSGENIYVPNLKGVFHYDNALAVDTQISVQSKRTSTQPSCFIANSGVDRSLVASVKYFPPKSTIVAQKSLSPDMAGFLSFSFFDMDESQGWLKADGRCVLKASYPDYLQNVGISYGECTVSVLNDGMNLPDMRGYFARALDDMGTTAGDAGRDPIARLLGDTQTDAMQGHRHRLYTASAALPDRLGGSSAAFGINTSPSGTAYDSIGNPYTDGSNGTPRTSSETRSKNMGLMAYVRMSNQDLVIGKFKDIDTTNNTIVHAESNNQEALTAAVDNIVWNETSDPNNAWDGSIFTAPENSTYHFQGMFRCTTATLRNVYSYLDTGSGFSQYRLANTMQKSLATDIFPIAVSLPLNAGHKIAFRTSTNNCTLELSPAFNYISIVQEPSTKSIIKNLNDESFFKKKCQIKFLSANLTAPSTDIADLRFTNLNTSKKYSVSAQRRAIGGDDSCIIRVQNNGVDILRLGDKIPSVGSNDRSTNGGFRQYVDITANSITTRFEEQVDCTLEGFSTASGTWVEICELPESVIKTSEW